MYIDAKCPICDKPTLHHYTGTYNENLYAVSKGRPRVKTYIHEQCYRKLTRGSAEQEDNHGEMQGRVQCDRSR